jgi:hypothetical protein
VVLWATPLKDFREGGFLVSWSSRLNVGLIFGNLGTIVIIALIPDDRRAQVFELVRQLLRLFSFWC